MRPFLQSGFSAKGQPQHGVYDDEDEDLCDGQYESTDDSTTCCSSSAGSYADSHSRSSSRTRPHAAGGSYLGNLGGQAPPPQSTSSGPAAHALQHPVPQWSTLNPAQRYQNPNLASPVGFNLPRRPVPSPASTTNSDPGNSASPAGPHDMNHRAAAETGFSVRRKPLNQPAGKRVLIAVFGMTGTGKTSFIKKAAGEVATQLQQGHDLESCVYPSRPPVAIIFWLIPYTLGTQDIETVDFKLDGHVVTLVDTLGFDDSRRSDTEILELIADWLQKSFKVCCRNFPNS